MCRSTATRRFTAGPRWRTARIPAARSGWRLSCAIAKGVGNHDRLASRSAHPLHRTRVVAAGRGHEPRPLPGPLTERSDLMTQKICFDCFHKLFPDKPIRKVTLGRQCVVCKAQTDRTEQMIPVEAEDIPLVKQIAQVPRRVLHRTERHADRRVAVRVAARGAGQVGRDAGQAGPRDPRHVRAMSADLDKAQAEGVELSHRCDNRRHRQQTVAVSHWARIGHKIC